MEKKYNTHGIIGSVIFHILMLLILIFFGLTTLPQEEEGILVNLGNVQTGLGPLEPAKSAPQPTPPVEEKTPPTPPKEESVSKAEENIKTQDFDEAPEVKSAEEIKKEKEEKERREKEEKERQEQLERERKLQEEADRKAKAEAEAKRQAELEEQRRLEEERKKREEEQRIKDEINSKVKGGFGNSNNNSSSEGDAGGSGNQGYTTGDADSNNRSGSGKGNSGSGFSLSGRSLIGSLPQPNDNSQEAGKIVIQITVDKYGKVIAAEFQLKGSTIQDTRLRNAAIEAAKKAKFNEDPNSLIQKGTITYHFELN